jgi:hypothetical protein
MGKYSDLQDAIFSVFGSESWRAENIKTVPCNFASKSIEGEFIRVNILPNTFGINKTSISGVMVIDIFTSAGEGPQRSSLIADKLDDFFTNRILGIRLQLGKSALDFVGVDSDNPTLFRAKYTITFNFFGVD